jgi:DNA uptake protein ComE-like DNA-binding protein
MEGFFEGWTRSDASLDLNSASLRQLENLPGITHQDAEQIVENRPYRRTNELVDKGVLPRAEYRRIRDQIEVKG